MMRGRPFSPGGATAQSPGADVEGIADDLADNGVAAPGEQGALADVVRDAASEDGLQLSVVVLPDDPGDPSRLQDIAQQLAREEGGTVLVLSPSGAGAFSPDFDNDEVQQAVQGLPGGNAEAASVFVDELTDPGPPWGWLLVAGAVLLVVVAAGGRWWERRRRRARDTAALAAEGKRLRAEVADMADEVLDADARVSVSGDSELQNAFAEVAVEYRELGHAVERDPTTRRDADALSARVRATRNRVDNIIATLNR
ncbi:MAG: hypothetical protein M3R63_03580 [Actinomycetota bacterium]|nr:hypothetical protein [Actinomycetota bacterium]